MASLTEIYSTLLSTAPFAVTLLVLFIFIEQISYLRKKSFIPGPSLILPFVGNVYSLINDPTKFWFVQSDYTKSSPLGISANYVIGKFMVFIRSTELSHKVFANVRPDAFHLIGHPFGKKLFGTHNMIYLFGQEHKDLRRRIVPNFTPKALSVYTAAQYTVILRHLRRWHRLCAAAAPKPIALRFLARDMNLETSQTVFAGPYLNEEERRRFNKDYSLFNEGLMKLPIDFPGTAFRNARNAVDRLVDTLTVCAVRSKERMVNGDEPPRCLIDFWMQETVREEREAAECRAPPPPHSGNREIGSHIFDFLFAAQDASTSSLLWAVTLLDAHPEVLSKVREEVRGIWNPEMGIPLTAENLGELKYTHAVAREILRYRAPATLVPHIAGEDFKLTEDYTIPKGTIVFPSVYESSFQGFPHPERFDPDRFYIEERKEDVLYKRNFLVFGAGAHQCVGQRYALNHLVLFISMFATCMDFKRQRSDGCDDLSYNPTICPKDDCLVSLSMTVN